MAGVLGLDCPLASSRPDYPSQRVKDPDRCFAKVADRAVYVEDAPVGQVYLFYLKLN